MCTQRDGSNHKQSNSRLEVLNNPLRGYYHLIEEEKWRGNGQVIV